MEWPPCLPDMNCIEHDMNALLISVGVLKHKLIKYYLYYLILVLNLFSRKKLIILKFNSHHIIPSGITSITTRRNNFLALMLRPYIMNENDNIYKKCYYHVIRINLITCLASMLLSTLLYTSRYRQKEINAICFWYLIPGNFNFVD